MTLSKIRNRSPGLGPDARHQVDRLISPCVKHVEAENGLHADMLTRVGEESKKSRLLVLTFESG